MINYNFYVFFKYFIVGVLNTALTFFLFCSFIAFEIHYVLSNFLAWFIGLNVSYILNACIVFEKKIGFVSFLKFLVSNVFSFIFATCLLLIFVEFFNITPVVASVVGIPFVVLLNFILSKKLVFK